ncbi:M23 family metallopeptidase [Candidatus Peregrinibacteria bacterium]|nr:M23 family metallopeptidase [Candidatus Peregrinibacteria bacterium]
MFGSPRRVTPRFLFKRFVAFIGVFFVVSSFQFSEASSAESFLEGYGYSLQEASFIMNEEGYLTQVVPAETEDGNWEGIAGTHTVAPGETLSQIATSYGLLPSTVIWENDLSNSNLLQIGQKLRILPADGVSYKVKKGDSLEKIGGKYEIDSKAIASSNNISGVIEPGQMIFLPGAKKIYEAPKYIASSSGTPVRNNTSASVGTISKVNVTPQSNKTMVFPTTGVITQGFSSAHYGVDISDPSKANVWVAASGTVKKAATGWNGGYGNMIIVDHGDGLETLYAHLDAFYVEVGQEVEQGEVIGRQGNTGRTYGRTGIHLHFEVHENGEKRNPKYYY